MYTYKPYNVCNKEIPFDIINNYVSGTQMLGKKYHLHGPIRPFYPRKFEERGVKKQ